jgi:hypothetical protein
MLVHTWQGSPLPLLLSSLGYGTGIVSGAKRGGEGELTESGSWCWHHQQELGGDPSLPSSLGHAAGIVSRDELGGDGGGLLSL